MSWVRSLPRWLTVLGGAMVVAGLGLIASGLLTDHTGWWAAHPFATNVVSAFASWLVGIPASVLFVAAVLDRVRDRRIEHEVQTVARGAVQDISERVSVMLASRASGQTIEQVIAAAVVIDQFVERRDSIRGPGPVQDAAALIERSIGPMSRDGSAELTAALSDLAGARRLAVVNAISFPDQATDRLVKRVAALVDYDDANVPADWSYSSLVDRARLAIGVRRAAEFWVTEAGRTWPGPA